MKLTFASEKIKKIKVGDMVPFGERIVKVEWTQDDVLPNPEEFAKFMKEKIHPQLVSLDIRFSLEAGPKDAGFHQQIR